jgi:hypothetical protein
MIKQAATACLATGMLLAVTQGDARAQSLPAVVTVPKAINLGSTSFFDAFGRQDPGFTLLEYGRYENLDRLTGATGANNPLFKGTQINVFVEQTQIAYVSPFDPLGLGGHLGFTVLQSVTDFASSNFDSDSPVKLTNNHLGLTDFNWGPTYQSKIYMQDGRPVAAWRVQFAVYSPTGSVDTSRNINQGNGYWAIAPYLSVTYLPLPRLEFSTRLNYQYDFATSVIQDPPKIPGVVYRNGQAGSIFYGNFDASYGVIPGKFFLGINSYFLQQLTDDRTNGVDIARSREEEASVGPGMRYVFDDDNALNFNVYLNVVSKNATTGTQANIQYVHKF